MPKPTSDQRARRDARREAREKGYEHRPTTAAEQREAARLNRGFAMLNQDDDEVDTEDDED